MIRRIESAHRGGSFHRASSQIADGASVRNILAECNEPRNFVDHPTEHRQYRTPHNDQGDTACSSIDLLSLLHEAAFDALGAARFVRGGNLGFARQALASAIAELTAARAALEAVS